MATVQTNPGGSLQHRPAGVPRSVMVVAGVAFLLLFIAWIPLYKFLTENVWPGKDQAAPSIVAALFWLGIFGVVVAVARASNTVFTSWQTRDVLFVAVVGAAFGELFLQWGNVYIATSSFLKVWNDLIGGFWWLPTILVPYVIRRPGAALLAQTLASAVELLAGSPYGVMGVLVAGMVEGMGAEVIFMLTGWKRYDWPTLILAGVAGAITGFVFLQPLYYATYPTDLLIITAIAYIVGVVLIAVVGGKLLGDALLATGVLDRFQIVRDRRAQAPSEDF